MSERPAPPAPRRLADKPPALGSLFAGVGLALARPRVWLPLTLVLVLLARVVAGPAADAAAASFGHLAGFAEDGTWRELGIIPRWFFDDQARLDGGFGSSAALAPLLLVASLLGVLSAAGWMECALRRREEHGLAAFLGGAGRHFFPFLRLWVLALAMYALVTWIVFGLPGDWLKGQLYPDGDPERASSENLVRWQELLYSLVYLWGLLKVEIIVDLARARLVAADRRSAVGALLRGIGFWIRRWWACTALVGIGLLLEAAVLFAAAYLARAGLVPLLALVWVVPAIRIVLRGGRQAGLALYYQQVVDQQQRRPLEHPPLREELRDEGSTWGGADA